MTEWNYEVLSLKWVIVLDMVSYCISFDGKILFSERKRPKILISPGKAMKVT